MTSKINNKDEVDLNRKWGSAPLGKLTQDLSRLKQMRPILADEPIFSNIISTEHRFKNSKINLENQNNLFKKEELQSKDQFDQTINPKIRPTIDSYIINTIKLNEILKNNVTFDQVEFFCKPDRKLQIQKQMIKKEKPKNALNSDQEAAYYLRNFIKIMSIHCGFSKASSLAIDILVDVLDHFIESFLKLFKNLKNIQLNEINKTNSKNSIHFTNQFSNHNLIEEAFRESGVGTIEDIKNFYINDIISYYRHTHKQVTKLYEAYKSKKLAEKLAQNATKIDIDNYNQTMVANSNCPDYAAQLKTEQDLKIEEFMRENDFLNDESNSILGELLTDLNANHFDEEINKLLQIIGPDPFSLIPDEINSGNNLNQMN